MSLTQSNAALFLSFSACWSFLFYSKNNQLIKHDQNHGELFICDSSPRPHTTQNAAWRSIFSIYLEDIWSFQAMFVCFLLKMEAKTDDSQAGLSKQVY